MPDVTQAVRDMHRMESLSRMTSPVHRLHPVVKILTTAVFLVALLSNGRHEVGRLLPFVLYPVMIASLADLPWKPFLVRVLAVEPLVVGIGVFSPLFEKARFDLFGVQISTGWLTFASLAIRTTLCVLVALQLVATTGMERILAGLRRLGLPAVMVLQIALTYRFLTVLAGEVGRILTAYRLRAPGHRGVHPAAWGSLAGQLLLRAFDRAGRVWQAMKLRGYEGHVPLPPGLRMRGGDWLWLAVWSAWFILSRMVNLPGLLGLLATRGR